MKDALESVPCEVFSIDHLKEHAEVQVLTRDNVHEWARENGGPIECTEAMCWAGAQELYGYDDADGRGTEYARRVYAAMEAKRREVR